MHKSVIINYELVKENKTGCTYIITNYITLDSFTLSWPFAVSALMTYQSKATTACTTALIAVPHCCVRAAYCSKKSFANRTLTLALT